MKPFTFTLRVQQFDEQKIICNIANDFEENELCYRIANDEVSILKDNEIAAGIQKNRHQLQKIMRSAIDGKMYSGQIINCVFIDDFFFLQEEHFNKSIRLGRRKGKLDITVSKRSLRQVHKIYADGSCNHQKQESGYGGFTETPDGTREPFFRAVPAGSSNLMELMAVTDGLERLVEIETVQVNTDSRYVIRGLVQWVHFWKYNNWQTAYGRDVRYKKHWQQADLLCEGKFIEFNWIKGHAENLEQNLCHQLAKAAAARAPAEKLSEICKTMHLSTFDYR